MRTPGACRLHTHKHRWMQYYVALRKHLICGYCFAYLLLVRVGFWGVAHTHTTTANRSAWLDLAIMDDVSVFFHLRLVFMGARARVSMVLYIYHGTHINRLCVPAHLCHQYCVRSHSAHARPPIDVGAARRFRLANCYKCKCDLYAMSDGGGAGAFWHSRCVIFNLYGR